MQSTIGRINEWIDGLFEIDGGSWDIDSGASVQGLIIFQVLMIAFISGIWVIQYGWIEAYDVYLGGAFPLVMGFFYWLFRGMD